MRNSVNFCQLLSKNVSDNGENISEIFDTLLCDREKVRFFVNVLYSQIVEKDNSLTEYYYRIVLRFLGKSKRDVKHARIDSGFFWSKDDSDDSGSLIIHRSTVTGASGRLTIDFGFNFEEQGNYQVELFVKKVDDSTKPEDFNKLWVKDLDLVSITPFSVIFKNS